MADVPSFLAACDPEILGGTLVFPGTRVPVESLFDHLAAGDALDDFLTGFPSVRREQALAVLNWSKARLYSAVERAPAA